MTRAEIRQRFRDEMPEATANVISDITLNSWLLMADKEICAKARLIVETASIVAVDEQAAYDLTALTKFYDIDENPGGGICRVTSSGIKRLDKKTKALLDSESAGWRTASAGTTRAYYRRGKYAYMYPAPDTASVTSFQVDFVKISDDFNNDAILPYNQLSYLEPYHPALIFYLIWRAKPKVGKAAESATAKKDYDDYVDWMKKENSGGKSGPINLVPSGLPSMGQYRS